VCAGRGKHNTGKAVKKLTIVYYLKYDMLLRLFQIFHIKRQTIGSNAAKKSERPVARDMKSVLCGYYSMSSEHQNCGK
jgi:hypothetical protein